MKKLLQRITHTTLGLLTCFGVTAYADHNSSHICNSQMTNVLASRFIANTDGTVTDTATGLIWMRCNFGNVWDTETKKCLGYSETLNWKDALNQVVLFNKQQLAVNKAATWRIPNIKELASIIDVRCNYNAIDESIFKMDSYTNYWTSTPVLRQVVSTPIYAVDGVTITGYTDEQAAWRIEFREGREEPQAVSKLFVLRLVRDGE